MSVVEEPTPKKPDAEDDAKSEEEQDNETTPPGELNGDITVQEGAGEEE